MSTLIVIGLSVTATGLFIILVVLAAEFTPITRARTRYSRWITCTIRDECEDDGQPCKYRKGIE